MRTDSKQSPLTVLISAFSLERNLNPRQVGLKRREEEKLLAMQPQGMLGFPNSSVSGFTEHLGPSSSKRARTEIPPGLGLNLGNVGMPPGLPFGNEIPPLFTNGLGLGNLNQNGKGLHLSGSPQLPGLPVCSINNVLNVVWLVKFFVNPKIYQKI